MKWIKIITLFFVLFSGNSMAMFKKFTEVPEIEVSGYSNFAGMNLTAFYISGRDAYFSTVGNVVNVNKVMAKSVVIKIDKDGYAKLPAIKVPRSGFSIFNNVVFVVHKQAAHYIKNYDPTSKVPNDPNLPKLSNGNTDWSKVSLKSFEFLSKKHVKAKELIPDGDGTVRLNFAH